jgi:hypothetical protein
LIDETLIARCLIRARLTVLPSADTAAMLFWALLASGQINMRKVDDWKTLTAKLIDQQLDLAAYYDRVSFSDPTTFRTEAVRVGLRRRLASTLRVWFSPRCICGFHLKVGRALAQE